MSEDKLQPDPVIEAYKRDIDRSLLHNNLKLTDEERVFKLLDEEGGSFGNRIRHDDPSGVAIR